MSGDEESRGKRASFSKLTKKRVMKVTSVVVVAILVLVSYHNLIQTYSAPDPHPPEDTRGNSGYEDFYYFAGGMVNTANGNLVISEKDISIKARGFDIEIVRTYNLQKRTKGYYQEYFGKGWTCNYFIRLTRDPEVTYVTLTEGDGSVHVYEDSGSIYYTPSGKHGKLEENPDGSFRLRYLDGSCYNFDSNGILQEITDKNRNKLTFSYGLGLGLLTKIEDDSGIYLNLGYSGTKIVNVTDPYGREVKYSYDSINGTLSNVTDPTGNITRYSYNMNTFPNSNVLLNHVIDKAGNRLNFSYEPYDLDVAVDKNDTYWVKRIYKSMWNDSSQSPYNSFKAFEFSYINYTNITPAYIRLTDTYLRMDITDARGYTTKVYVNDYGNPLKIEDPTGNYTKKEWDSDFNVIKFTDKANNIYNYTYDNYTEGGKLKTYGRINKTTDPLGHYTVNSWSFQDEEDWFIAYLSKVLHKNEYSTEYTYDDNYNLDTVTDANENTSTRVYDTYGNMIIYEDFRGHTTSYSYDRYGNLLNVTDSFGYVTEYRYDQKSRLKNVTNPRGFVTTYEYDDLDRIVKITDALGNSTKYIYDEGSEGVYSTGAHGGCGGGYSIGGHTPIAIIDPNGHRTNLTLNHTIKRIEKIEESAGCGCSEKIFKYDNNGNLIEFTDARGNKTTYEYDSLNRLIKENDARRNYTSYTYDSNGNLITVTNRRGYSTSYDYDALNRKTMETDPNRFKTYYTYDEEGNLETVKNARGYTTTYYYDNLNRLEQIKDASNNSIYYTYDENGNKVTETDPNGNTITYEYDDLNRLIKVKDALNHETNYDYDSVGNKLNVTDANGKKTKYAYDALNRLISVTDANNNVTTYSYDASGHLLNITDANGHKTRQEYDSLYRLKKIIYPSGNYTEYSYDGVGNQIERKDAKGLSTYYTYNEINRLVQIKYPDNGTIVYEYDQEGNPTKVTNNAGFGETTYYIYDKMDRVTSVKVDYGLFDKYVNYTYDGVGNRKTMIDPEGNITYYNYDTMDRLINITSPGHNPILFTYDNAGRRTRLDYPNGVYTTYSYDNTNRITSIWHKKSGGSTIAVYNYTYDNVRNILNFTENDLNYTTYTYDNIYQLMNVSYPDGNWTAYTYDGVGNRLTMKTSSGITFYTYDADNRILTAGSISYEHDKTGNPINKTDGGNITLYEYDYDNRLIKVTLPNSNTVIYQYSADWHRLNKTTSNGMVLYLYDGDNILMEMDTNGSKTAFYAYGPNIDEPSFMARNGATYYYHADHLGSIRILTDANGNMVATYMYDAFGTILSESGSVTNPYRFTGREWDVESGLYYYRARYYNAVVGRFLQKDPKYMVDGPNMYAYVKNNPVNFRDPTGTFWLAYRCIFRYTGWRIVCSWYGCWPKYGTWCLEWEFSNFWRS